MIDPCVLQQELRKAFMAKAQLASILPQVISAAQNSRLKQVLQQHSHQTNLQVDRLETGAQQLDITLQAWGCTSVQELICDLHLVMQTQPPSPWRDAMLANKLRLINQYMTVVYAKIKDYARPLRNPYLMDLLHLNQQEEENTETQLAIIVLRDLVVSPSKHYHYT